MPLKDYWWCILVAKYGAFLFTEIGVFLFTDYKEQDCNHFDGGKRAFKSLQQDRASGNTCRRVENVKRLDLGFPLSLKKLRTKG